MNQKQKYDPRLLHEQVSQLYAQSYIATIGAVTVSIVTGFMLWGYVPHINLIIWIIAAVAITMIRHGVIIYFHRIRVTAEEAAHWKNIFIVLIFISGLIWGSSGMVVFPGRSMPHQVFLFFILGGMVAGGIGTFSVVIGAFAAYAYPALLPLMVKFFFIGNTIHSAMGFMALLYLILASITAYHLYVKTRIALNLRFENIDLVDRLAREKQKTDSINKILTDEILERKRAEAALKKNKAALESQVAARTEELRQANIELIKEIEERKKTLKALRESEEKYRLLVENANEAVCIHQDGQIKFHNRQAESLLGYSAEELTAMPYLDYFHPDDRNSISDLQKAALKATPGELFRQSYDFRAFHKNGTMKWVRISLVPVTWENRPAVLCFTRDITRKKHLEEQLLQSQKMEAIGTMAASIAHDFNNILSAISGNISLALLKADPADPLRKRLLDIESYIENGTALTQPLLSFARSKKTESRPADMDRLVVDTANLFCRTRKNLRLHTACSGTSKIAEVDRNQIRQALINLLMNAWQAMPDGGDLHISTEILDLKGVETEGFDMPAGKYIKITIADTGVGIDADTLPKIFDPFFTTKKKAKGTGLGLASAYAIIKSHDGYITVDSTPGRGSAFNIHLPASEKQAIDQKPAGKKILKGDETILLVDDEADLLEIGKEMLKALGYTVIPARNGEEAIRLYTENKNRIRLVILDMIMPEMTGEQVFDRLSAIDPTVRVLLASGYIQSSQAEKVLKKGAGGFIRKPFSIQQLSQAVRKILNGS